MGQRAGAFNLFGQLASVELLATRIGCPVAIAAVIVSRLLRSTRYSGTQWVK